MSEKKPALNNTTSPEHYNELKWKVIITMLVIAVIPLATMLIINHFQYKSHLKSEVTRPLYAMANKTRHSFELFLEERLSTIRFISTAYTYAELKNKKIIEKIFVALKKELTGFVDLGLMNPSGDLVSYAGPYALLGKNYKEQRSFQETRIKGHFISNVFMGYRKNPHVAIAVQHLTSDGNSWILRATIDTDHFYNLINSIGLDFQSDAFLVNSDGIMQTDSKYYGRILEKCKLDLTPERQKGQASREFDVLNMMDENVIIASADFSSADYKLVLVKPYSVVLKSWYALKTELILVFTISLGIIVFTVFKMAGILIDKIRKADEKREHVMAELQHTQKLSSIGRLAAGVAHEINNPLAIINEKAGLLSDLTELTDNLDNKLKFNELTESIIKSVERCKKITHRLLGFSKRIDVKIESLNVNVIIHEVLEFLEKEAMYRRIDIRLELFEPINSILSDFGQLQQVFLNLLTNAFAAVEDGGIITITSKNRKKGVIVKIADNGCGIPETILSNIFDPFFSTKKEKGTGLGLSITYGIINKLSGQISVESTEGVGTVFAVKLPEKPNEKTEPEDE
ncbi:MAG: ATP-binding protein [Desulfobacteraceae bacterium]